MLTSLRLRLRAFFNRSTVERELDYELRFHLEEQTQFYLRQGLSREEAARQARVRFGSLPATIEAAPLHRRGKGLDGIVGDVRYAMRTLWRDRGLAVAGILTLTLGVGATTAVFSAVNAVMLRELPFRDSGRLVAVWEENVERNWYKNVVAPANYLDWRERVRAFDGQLAGYNDFLNNVTLLGRGEPQLLTATPVTGNFLSVLGVTPALGRGFEDADTWDNGQRPAMLSHRAWKNRFRGDSSVIGTSISLGGARAWQIIGVMPEGFAFPSPATDIYLPALFSPNNRTQVFFRRAHYMRVVGRLADGVSAEAAQAQLKAVAKQLEGEYPATNVHMDAGVTPLREWIVGDTKRPLVVLLAAAGVLLLIACANVGNLLLVHALSRSRDVSLRFALGASRSRVARQALTESLVLSGIGGVGGFALGWAGARALLAMQPSGMLPVTDIAIDYRVLGFAILLTTVSGLVFGIAPAVIATRQSPADSLNAGGRSIAGGGSRKWGRHLVVAEVALAVMLTVGAGLLLRSYERLSSVAPGFTPEGVMTASMVIPASRYDSAAKVVGFYSALLERVSALPGVERAAAVRQLPATVGSWSSSLAIAGREPLPQTDILHREVMGDYFRVMRVPLLQGRTFTEADGATLSDSDTPESPLVVIVNDALAKEFFPNENPVGLRISFDRIPDSTSNWRTIVGVVGSERQGNLATPARPEIFAPMKQEWTRGMTIVARMRDGHHPIAIAGPIRRAVRDLDSLLALTAVRPMTQVHAEAMSRERFISALVLVFAITGVALALVGVFGVLAQLVQSRWREMGIRLALGAQRSDVRWMVVRHGAALLGMGIVAGLVVALWATRTLAKLLYEVAPTDMLTYAAVAVVIGGAGMVAAWVPALRASTANPANTLRAE
jgi:putative ABC transport system permease protein